MKITTQEPDKNISADVKAINEISIVPQLLDVVCRSTGMGFAAVARVTENKWVTCQAKDLISFGLQPGDELVVESTICHEIRQSEKPVVIEHVDLDSIYCTHHTPKQYGFQSYISFPIFRKDGTFFGTLCAIDPNPAKINTPEITGMFQLFADLIAFHLQALEQMNDVVHKLAEEREKAELRDQFIAILGHDLRNPIATTRMSAEIIENHSQEELSRRNARMIKSTSYRMEGLIENILDFARGQLGNGIIPNKKTDNKKLEASLQQVIKEIKTLSPERQVEVKVNLQDPINCDANRVAQLFSNLLGNADTHGEKGEPIWVKAVTKKKEFQLSVCNAGKKISDEAIKHLFEPFYRQSSKKEKKGLGLGLYISSEIARAHRGTIDVDSNEEQTCFTFRMPLD